jgi:hypothetical protein
MTAVIWRAAIIAGYVALAIVVGVAYGSGGLIVLAYFYFLAGSWVVFLIVWGRVARAAGRWNVDRLDPRSSDRR